MITPDLNVHRLFFRPVLLLLLLLPDKDGSLPAPGRLCHQREELADVAPYPEREQRCTDSGPLRAQHAVP